jgi:hypothetical protein
MLFFGICRHTGKIPEFPGELQDKAACLGTETGSANSHPLIRTAYFVVIQKAILPNNPYSEKYHTIILSYLSIRIA